MYASAVYLERNGSGPSALRVVVPQNNSRIPTHFIALIDTSDSMLDDSKLTNVKHCMSLLLKFLTPDDRLSLITFGETSEIVLNRVQTDSMQIPVIEKEIESLKTNGCTNYSAGLAAVTQIMNESYQSACMLKPGLLTFTDGHANRGLSDPASLIMLISRLYEIHPSLSFSFIAYGHDHNAVLLKEMAGMVMGAYSIVNDLEAAATAMGYCLGSIISCAAQNVTIQCPEGTTAEGPYTVKKGQLALGDLYAGTETTVLLNIAEGPGPLMFSGVLLPDLISFNLPIPTMLDTTPNVEIDVTRLRYKCSDMFRQIREILSSGRVPDFNTQIEEFRAAIQTPAYAAHPVIPMLAAELASIEAAIQNIRAGQTRGLDTQLTQHAAFNSLMRGITTSIESQSGSPTQHSQVRGESASDPIPEFYLSPTSSTRQRRMATMMRAATSGGAPLPDDFDNHEPC